MILVDLLNKFVAREQLVIYKNFPKKEMFSGKASDVPVSLFKEEVITVGAYSGLHSPVIEICLR